MTVIPGVPRAPKGNYRPATIIPDHTVDHQAITHDPSLTTDPYLHPTYAHAFRRPPSPIAEGKFDPSVHAEPPIRRQSVSQKNTATSAVSRTKSIPLPPPAPPVRRPHSPAGHKRHGSSGSISTHPSSKGSSPASHPPSILTSPDHSPPPSPAHVAAVKPVIPPQAPVSDDETDPVSAIMLGSTRAGKLTKRRRSERTVTSQNSTAPSSPVVAPDPPKAKSRSRFGFLRFGKAAAGRVPPEPFPEAMLPPERQPSTRDIGEPSGRFLSPASSFVVLDGPPSPPPESIGVPLPNPLRTEGERAPQYRDSPIYGLEGNRYIQGDLAAKMAQANLNLDRVDGLDTTGPYGLSYHNGGPYDAIGSVVGSQRDSRMLGSPADMRNRHSLLPPSIAGSSVHAGHRTYPGIGSASQAPPGAALSSPYPPNVEFIPEALPPGQMQAYSSHSRAGSGGSGGSQNSYGSARGPPVLPHAHVGSAGRYSRELVHPGEQYGGYAPQPESNFTDGPLGFIDGRPASDDFYNGQQARFAAPPEDHSDGQREEGQWDGEHGSDYDNHLYHRRSRDEDVKFVPMRQPIVSPANDIQSHYGHESQVYSEHRSHHSGGGSIMSGNSAGRGSLPSRHQPRSLVMPSPLQGSHSSPPLAPEGSPGGHGYNQRHSRSPAQYSNGRRSRDHSQNRSSMAPSWQSPSLYGQPQAAVIPMNTGKGGRLHKK